MKRLVLAAALVLPLALAHAGGNPTPQQYCQKYKVSGEARSSMSININGQTCTMKTPAKQLCTAFGFLPVGIDVIVPTPNYVCYKVKCPKQIAEATVTDQFGTHVGTTKAPNVACFATFSMN